MTNSSRIFQGFKVLFLLVFISNHAHSQPKNGIISIAIFHTGEHEKFDNTNRVSKSSQIKSERFIINDISHNHKDLSYPFAHQGKFIFNKNFLGIESSVNLEIVHRKTKDTMLIEVTNLKEKDYHLSVSFCKGSYQINAEYSSKKQKTASLSESNITPTDWKDCRISADGEWLNKAYLFAQEETGGGLKQRLLLCDSIFALHTTTHPNHDEDLFESPFRYISETFFGEIIRKEDHTYLKVDSITHITSFDQQMSENQNNEPIIEENIDKCGIPSSKVVDTFRRHSRIYMSQKANHLKKNAISIQQNDKLEKLTLINFIPSSFEECSGWHFMVYNTQAEYANSNLNISIPFQTDTLNTSVNFNPYINYTVNAYVPDWTEILWRIEPNYGNKVEIEFTGGTRFSMGFKQSFFSDEKE